MEELIGFTAAGFALIGSPGPNTLSLAATGAAFGAVGGLRYMAGILTGMILVMSAISTGLGGVLLAIPGVTPVVAIVAATYILWLAYRIAAAPPLATNGDPDARPSFRAGLFLSLVNPKGYASMAALYSGFVLVEGDFLSDAAVKLIVVSATMLVVNTAWLLAGAALTRAFQHPTVNRAINMGFALLLVISVVFAFSL